MEPNRVVLKQYYLGGLIRTLLIPILKKKEFVISLGEVIDGTFLFSKG